VKLLLLAPPGAGKGTQGERLAAWAGVRHIAAGDLLRDVVRAGGPLGAQIAAYQARGDLVPDQIVIDALTPVVVEAAAHGGYILDGFPRTLPQAIAAADLALRLGVRLRVFAETTGPLVPYYRERGILVAVDADQPVDSVTADIQARLTELLTITGSPRDVLAARAGQAPAVPPAVPSAVPECPDKSFSAGPPERATIRRWTWMVPPASG